MRVQVLIVGAGPTGLALACQCLRLGLRVRIIDRKRGPSLTSKAIGLQYRVSEILACMGLIENFIDRSGSPTTVNIYAESQRLVSLRFLAGGHESGRGAFSPRALMIPQSETEQILGTAVADRGGTIEWSTELIGLAQDDSGVRAQVRLPSGSEQELSCEWLLSCEGAHSVARKAVGIEFIGKTYPLSFLMADVRLEGEIAASENHVWMHRDGSFAALPFARENRWRLFIEITRRPLAGLGTVDIETIRSLMQQRIGKSDIRIDDPTWISSFAINCRIVDRYRNGRVLLAGDAAHIHSPTGGQGIATGIQDAVNLAWKLGRVIEGAPDALLDTYQQERRAHAEEVLRETDRTTTIFFAPSRLTRLLRDWVVLPLLRSEWLQRRMFAKLSQLHVSYHASGLSRDDRSFWRAHTGVRAGERAPDLLLQKSAGGEHTSLFKLLERARPVLFIGPGRVSPERVRRLLERARRLSIVAWLIALPNSVAWHAPERCLIDVYDALYCVYGLTGEFICLVRPDDHVGLIQAPIDEQALHHYLRQISPPVPLGCVNREAGTAVQPPTT
jgi:4,5-epoxidase